MASSGVRLTDAAMSGLRVGHSGNDCAQECDIIMSLRRAGVATRGAGRGALVSSFRALS
jgi:hypothetical protein